MSTSTNQTNQATQYLNLIAAPPELTPTPGALVNDPSTGTYSSYAKSGQTNVQGTATGVFTSYIGGSDGILGDAYTALLSSIEQTFQGVTSSDIEKYFNSLTSANANAVQYTSSGAASTFVPGTLTSPASLLNQALVSTTNLQTGVTTFGETLPSSFSDLASSMLSFFKTKHPSMTLPSDIKTTSMYNTFFNVFNSYIQGNTDWSLLGTGSNLPLLESQFQAAFSAFLNHFPSTQIENVKADGTYNLVSTRDFLDSWLNFTTATSTIQSSTQSQPVTVGSDPNANQYVLNYQAIYKAFFPNSTAQDFQTFFTNFYNETVSNPANGGYFLPSQFIGDFFKAVLNKYAAPMRGQAAKFTNLSTPTLGIIWEVLARIQQMVNIIQQLSVYVSQYLTFLTHYQTAYTNLIATIPTFSSTTPVVGDANVDTRNQQLSNYRSTLSSYRDQITATSKGAQSYLDTLSQASSNALNQGGALLTMLNGLLTIIHAS